MIGCLSSMRIRPPSSLRLSPLVSTSRLPNGGFSSGSAVLMTTSSPSKYSATSGMLKSSGESDVLETCSRTYRPPMSTWKTKGVASEPHGRTRTLLELVDPVALRSGLDLGFGYCVDINRVPAVPDAL